MRTNTVVFYWDTNTCPEQLWIYNMHVWLLWWLNYERSCFLLFLPSWVPMIVNSPCGWIRYWMNVVVLHVCFSVQRGLAPGSRVLLRRGPVHRCSGSVCVCRPEKRWEARLYVSRCLCLDLSMVAMPLKSCSSSLLSCNPLFGLGSAWSRWGKEEKVLFHYVLFSFVL